MVFHLLIRLYACIFSFLYVNKTVNWSFKAPNTIRHKMNQILFMISYVISLCWTTTSSFFLVYIQAFLTRCVSYMCCMQQSMLLSSLLSLLICQKEWTASSWPALRCDSSLSLSVFPLTIHSYTLHWYPILKFLWASGRVEKMEKRERGNQ